MNRYQASVPDALRALVSGNLVAFLELALAVDAGRYPSLPRFLDELARMREGDAQDAPDEATMGNDGDAVRILTVHAAKGLEASVVFIVDAHRIDSPDRGFDVLLDWPPDAARPAHFSVYGKAQDRGLARQALFQSEDQQARQEETNALYVAMTRAKQALIISGSAGKKGANSGSWYATLRDAMELDDMGGAVGDDLHGCDIPFEQRPLARDTDSQAVDQRLRFPLNIGRREVHYSSPQTRHGERVHRLLQFMSPPAAVADDTWLRELLACDEDEFQVARDAAQTILQAAPLRRFFDSSAYVWAANEWVIMVDREFRRVDRVVEFADEVWVLDYKTGENVDADGIAMVTASHNAQLELYRRAAMQLLPDKPVRSALVFANGRLHVVK
jgi:ATP-dependent helicase/nuclease subunit A